MGASNCGVHDNRLQGGGSAACPPPGTIHCPCRPPRRTRDLYIHGMREMPLLVAHMAPRARVPATVYVPPPLQANGFLWHPEHNKAWEFAGLPAYSL